MSRSSGGDKPDEAPIDMLLFCPRCQMQHVDAPEPDKGWTNPPHATHTCKGCGLNWRPSNALTNGVAGLASTEQKHIERFMATDPRLFAPSHVRPTTDSIPRYYIHVTGDPKQKFDYAIDDQSGFVESENGAWMRAHDVDKALASSATATTAPKLNPSVLPALPGQKALTVVMLKDDGDVQADAAIEAVKRGDTILLPGGVSELFFHQLRLRVALEPSLADKLAIYYLLPGERQYKAVVLDNDLRWPVGFLNDCWEKEIQINAAKCADDASEQAVKMRDELRAKYGLISRTDGGNDG